MSDTRHARYLVCVVGLSISLLGGCPPQSSGGDASGNSNTNGSVTSAGFEDNGLAEPGPLAAEIVNAPPSGALLFPPAASTIATGDVVFLWEATDANNTNLDSTVFVSADPDVFGNALVSAGRRSAPDEVEHRLGIQLPDEGTFYWGVRMTDGVSTVDLPEDGVGLMFDTSATSFVRIGADDVVLLCPRDTQPARTRTTFSWSLGGVMPTRSQVFVSRAGSDNPFDAPLGVFDLADATATSRALSDAEALPVGETLSWGLRLETASEVLFTFAGQLGASFLVADNVPPSGELRGPADGAIWADADTSFELSWNADPGNCEDVLTSTLFFELATNSSDADSLFSSPISLAVAEGGRDVDLVNGGEPVIPGGVWRWGVLADDGTDATRLVDANDPTRVYRTFVRDTAPRFVMTPIVGPQPCSAQQVSYDAVTFSFADDNGLDTVGVTVTYAATQADVFTAPTAALSPVPGTSGGDGVVFLQPTGLPECPDFDQGGGFYGIELSDGVNDPVRSVVEFVGPPIGACCQPDGSCTEGTQTDCNTGSYQGDDTLCAQISCAQPPPPDCNGNGIPDDQDIAQGTSLDCNLNQVPDECEGSPIVVDAGTLLPGVIDGQGGYDSRLQNNDLSGSICPPQQGTNSAVVWSVDSRP
ncbi:MAG: hypothetical protein ACE5E5_11105, partial [Phycisphaerae bacterium]